MNQNNTLDIRCHTHPALVTGTGASYTTTVTAVGVIGGEFVTGLTAQTNAALPTTDLNTSAAFPGLLRSQGTVLVWGQNAAGTTQIAQGTIEDLDSSGNFLNAPQFPPLPDTFMPFAYQVLKAGITASATVKLVPGVDAWAATGYTNVIVPIATLPVRPQVA
jgi:hypothetical protein